jgi:hypothetical protein
VPDEFSIGRDWLAPAWLARLRGALEDSASSQRSSVASKALDRLRIMHRASARVDLGRVHPSWLVRALQEESPAVQRFIAGSTSASLRDALQSGLLLDSHDLATERAPSTEVSGWVMALWTERLVGGEPERADDSPAIMVLSRLSPRAGYRLCRLAGLYKIILAGHERLGRDRAIEHARRHSLEDHLATTNQDFVAQARLDIKKSNAAKWPARHLPARVGLSTIARLLIDAEPFRLRWALQHWPYPVAKLVRSLIPTDDSPRNALRLAESLILRIAWDRLHQERRLAVEWPLRRGDDGSELN